MQVLFEKGPRFITLFKQAIASNTIPPKMSKACHLQHWLDIFDEKTKQRNIDIFIYKNTYDKVMITFFIDQCAKINCMFDVKHDRLRHIKPFIEFIMLHQYETSQYVNVAYMLCIVYKATRNIKEYQEKNARDYKILQKTRKCTTTIVHDKAVVSIEQTRKNSHDDFGIPKIVPLHEQIVKRPETYVGSISQENTPMYVWEDKMVYREMMYTPGLYKLFDELLVNALDNKQRCDNMRVLNICITDRFFTIENDGDTIPVEKHEKHDCWLPEMCFGQLLTSTNYDDTEKRTTGGRNGYGANVLMMVKTVSGECSTWWQDL